MAESAENGSKRQLLTDEQVPEFIQIYNQAAEQAGGYAQVAEATGFTEDQVRYLATAINRAAKKAGFEKPLRRMVNPGSKSPGRGGRDWGSIFEDMELDKADDADDE